ncbi:MAG: T9SS type A sorting domain-containing protein [Fidelibacterota bacterium]|nr:MAG: T9SS type A sorting domain-containing protein [Candidatus Neomarinimicrobiota bacterium]
MRHASGLIHPKLLLMVGVSWVFLGSLSGMDTRDAAPGPVRYLSGSDYEIGIQRGGFTRDQYERWEGRAESLFSRKQGAAMKLALEFRMTEISESYPGLLQEWCGTADAVGIRFEDVAVGMIGENVLCNIAQLPVIPGAGDPGPREACSAFGMTHSDRGPILGKTSDSHSVPSDTRIWPDEDLEIYDYEDGYRVMMFGYGILNDQGLAVGDANAHYEGATGTGDGQAGRLAPVIARYCPTVDSAVSFIMNYTITDDGRHFCLVDSSGKAAAVEVAPGGLVNVRWGDSTGYVYVTNTSPDSLMKAHDTNDSAYVANSDNRLVTFERMFTDTAFQFTFDDAESIIFSHDTVGAICQHGDSIEGQWNTTRSRLILPAEGKMYVAARADTGTSYHPCEHAWRVFEFPPLALEQRITTALPDQAKLHQNYPNPFNAHTNIAYRLTTSGHVRVEVYSLSGDRVKLLHNSVQPNGDYSVVWDGTDEAGRAVASGLYYYRLEAGDVILTKRMTLVK